MNLSKKKRATPRISVVIPTYNGMSTLGACLGSISRQELSRKYYEIILVDDGSKEDISQIAKRYGTRSFRQQNNGPASARNLGAKKARGSIIAFTDDDCTADKGWLRMLLKKYAEGADAVGGLVLPSSEDTVAEKFESLRKKMLYGSKSKIFSKGNIGYLPTCNFSIKKEVFERIGGFDTTFKFPSGEDTDLCYRLCRNGGTIHYFPEAIVFHHHPSSLKGVFKRQYLHSRENVILFRKNFGMFMALKAAAVYAPALVTILVLPLYLLGATHLMLLLPFVAIFLLLPPISHSRVLAGTPLIMRVQILLISYLAQAIQAVGYYIGLLKYVLLPSNRSNTKISI